LGHKPKGLRRTGLGRVGLQSWRIVSSIVDVRSDVECASVQGRQVWSSIRLPEPPAINLTKDAMSIDSRSTKQPVRPSYPQSSRAAKAAMALIAVLVASTLLGGMLSMFEMRADATAMARASVRTQPATDGLAARKVDSGPRG
jgi:hypothetical protein